MIVSALFVALPLAHAAPAATANASPFVGFWYGVGEPDDPSISYIDAYRADGTFNSEFRKCEKGEVVWRQTETGKWSFAKGELRMVSETIDGKKATFDNVYTIEAAMKDEFHARLPTPNFLFVEKRIAKFEFPPCYVGA